MLVDFCTYNIWGLNNKQAYLKDFIRNNKISLVAVLETHVQHEQSAVISNNVALNFSWIFNYSYHVNGRIWVGYDSTIWKLSVLTLSAQHITCTVQKLATNDSFVVSFVYGYNTNQERGLLWRELSGVANLIPAGTAWALIGDFNVCLGPEETNKGLVWTRGMLDFRDFVTSEGLVDLSCSGPKFTWWDSCKSDPCFRKLDRCIVNSNWISQFSLSKALILPRGLSDHSPILVSLGVEMKRVRKPFQFFVHLIEAPGFWKQLRRLGSWSVLGTPGSF